MRYRILDSIRGISLISMIAYHLIWDLVYLFGMEWKWYQSTGGYVWQQSICWTFILLSGFCWSIGNHPLKRGVNMLVIGSVITLATVILMPENRIVFGILTLIGSCNLILIGLEKSLKRVHEGRGLLLSMFLFILMKQVNNGYIGFGEDFIFRLPDILYQGYFTTYIGFTAPEFYSADYFSLIPWCFLFIAGYFLYQIVAKKDGLRYLYKKGIGVIEYIGRHSLIVYVLHQPIIYLSLSLCF
ncbi:MAG: DUF1624 domain-containing protein [Cellulosilyticum sp.]|nr:DUF1624 domain-containing protein [Cellulosilyticum sp.]